MLNMDMLKLTSAMVIVPMCHIPNIAFNEFKQ